MTAAPLKPETAQGSASSNAAIRGHMTAAPLKQVHGSNVPPISRTALSAVT